MKISDVKVFFANISNRNLVYVKVLTDEGLHGIGEAYSVGPDKATKETIGVFPRVARGRRPHQYRAPLGQALQLSPASLAAR